MGSSRRSTRKIAMAVALAAGAALSVSGCSADNSDSDATAPGAADLLIWTDDLQAPGVTEAANKFAEEYDVVVAVESIASELQTQFVTAAQAGNSPDIVLGAHDWIGNLVQNGTIDPIQMSEEQRAEFNPLAIEAVTFNGQILGVPYGIENIVLFRNPDLAPEAPASFEEMVAVGEELQASGEVSEIVAVPVSDSGNAYYSYPLFTSAGGYLFGEDENGGYDPEQLGLADPVSEQAMAKLAEHGETGTGALKRSINEDNALALFVEGDAPFFISGPWSIPQIEESGIPYEISAIPGFEDGGPARPFIGAYGMYVASGGEHKVLAQEFATVFWPRKDVAVAYFEASGRAPALLSAYDEVAPDNPNMVAIVEAGKEGDPMPSIPEMAAIWSPFGIAEAAVLAGEDPVEATQAAATAVQNAIG